jgi:hypothetical protein
LNVNGLREWSWKFVTKPAITLDKTLPYTYPRSRRWSTRKDDWKNGLEAEEEKGLENLHRYVNAVPNQNKRYFFVLR